MSHAQAPAAPSRPHGERPGHAATPAVEAAIEPLTGWHVAHLFYAFDHAKLATLDAATIAEGCRQFAAALDPAAAGGPVRLQSWIVPGHKADFGVMVLDPSPLTVDGVHQRLRAGPSAPRSRPPTRSSGSPR